MSKTKLSSLLHHHNDVSDHNQSVDRKSIKYHRLATDFGDEVPMPLQTKQSLPLVRRKNIRLNVVVFVVLALFAILYISCYILKLNKNDDKPNKVSLNLHDGYLINTEQCNIIKWPTFDGQTRPLYSTVANEFRCNRKDFTDSIRRINYTAVQVPNGADCTAKYLQRKADGETYQLSGSVSFNGLKMHDFANDTDAVEVTCKGKYSRIVPLVPFKQPLGQNNPNSAPVNILLIGIDSLSRLQFLRHYPKSKAFMDAHNFIPLYGYHKVGDNSYPNLIPLLTGHYHTDFNQVIEDNNRKLDKLPLIFKALRKAGYLTTYIEDMPQYGLFTYHQKEGFIEPPVDYYTRPLNLLVHKNLNRVYCYKNKLEFELYYNYILDQMAAFHERSQRFMTMCHLGSIIHDVLNYAHYGDAPLYRFLNGIFDRNLHQDTLIVFYSDHGIRFGKILKTDSGFFESRLPVIYVHVPEKLKLKDHTKSNSWIDAIQLREILNINAHRLTSHFDVHSTMQHLLRGIPPSNDMFPFGQSLFTVIPENRTCEIAGIPLEYCACYKSEPYHDDVFTKTLANAVVHSINNRLEAYRNECVVLQLKDVNKCSLYKHTGTRSNQTTNLQAKQMFEITFTTKPNNGQFETLIEFTQNSQNSTTETIDADKVNIISDIIRLDRYEKQSKCVSNSPVESFCYCRNMTTTT